MHLFWKLIGKGDWCWECLTRKREIRILLTSCVSRLFAPNAYTVMKIKAPSLAKIYSCTANSSLSLEEVVLFVFISSLMESVLTQRSCKYHVLTVNDFIGIAQWCNIQKLENCSETQAAENTWEIHWTTILLKYYVQVPRTPMIARLTNSVTH